MKKQMMTVAVVLTASLASAELVRKGAGMTVTWDEKDGTLASLVLDGDPHAMNWIEGTDRWGRLRLCETAEPQDTKPMEFVALREEGEAVVSVYKRGKIRAEVRRTVTDGGLAETYVFTNTAHYPIYFLRGHVGILTTFNDSYVSAEECETKRCHAHLWCGGENAWVRALKMGPFPTELALVLQQGAIDAYSVRRLARESSNDRGDFVLHPAPFHLKAGESKTVAWKVVPYPAGRFDETLLKEGGVKIAFKQETIFPNETFEVDVTGPDGVTKHYSRKPDKGVGVYDFVFEAGGKKATAVGYCSPALEDLLRARMDFLCDKQQCLEKDSPLYGAFLLWDYESDAPYFDYVWRDYNANRERMIMGCTVARWLLKHDDPKVRRALDLFEQFVRRESFDEKTCTVYDTIGKDPTYKRLYNAPQVVMFLRELYALKKDPVYLDWIERAILDYYKRGGEKFYPNGCDFSSELVLLEKAGRKVSELRAGVERHVANIVRNGIRFPPHEVRFEQTIATPATTILAQYARYIGRPPELMDALRANLDILSRFQGNQPSHKLDETAIRHWDGFWFGKKRVYGDTLHQHSGITARSFLQCAAVTGDKTLVARAERCLRNCLYMFRADGSATCAVLLPLTVAMLDKNGAQSGRAVRGDFMDPFVNDQDSVLYFCMGSGLFGDYGATY